MSKIWLTVEHEVAELPSVVEIDTDLSWVTPELSPKVKSLIRALCESDANLYTVVGITFEDDLL